jgi:uncharacterized protein YhfF
VIRVARTEQRVDDAFAWYEGEGDHTRAYWLDAHTRYFSRTLATAGLAFHPDTQWCSNDSRSATRSREPNVQPPGKR